MSFNSWGDLSWRILHGTCYLNNIDNVTIATTGNAADFGDLTQQMVMVPRSALIPMVVLDK